MSVEIKVPVLPESVSDATVSKWYKKVGDAVTRDENLVDLETDKVMLEVPAPNDGVIEKIVVEEGAIVTADEVLAIIKEGAAAAVAAQPVGRDGSRRARRRRHRTRQDARRPATSQTPDRGARRRRPATGRGVVVTLGNRQERSDGARRRCKHGHVDPPAEGGAGRSGLAGDRTRSAESRR